MGDVNVISKRLNLIKSLILLEEFEDITGHLTKLNSTADDSINEIIKDLSNGMYSDAIVKIENYLNKTNGLLKYEDPEIEALKIEIKKLENEISETSDEFIEIEKVIHDFGLKHSIELGETINKILKLRAQKLAQEQEQDIKKKREYEEAKKDYEEYNEQYNENKKESQNQLTEEEKIEIKLKYRKATKLCHPDVVTDELKEYAEAMFRELQTAYEKNDLKKITEILNALENGKLFISKSEGINEKIKLKAELIKLRNKLAKLKDDLNKLKENESYTTISKITNWDEYFKNLKEKLNNELFSLEN